MVRDFGEAIITTDYVVVMMGAKEACADFRHHDGETNIISRSRMKVQETKIRRIFTIVG